MREAGVPLKQVGRYTIFDQIGAGGMATVHLARFAGPAGFSRVVAVKHLLPHLSLDTEFRALIVEEARTASRVRHPNVVPTLDVVVDDGDVYIVMEYVPGEALGFLRRAAKEARKDIPPAICSAIIVGVLQGLHAAHEARTPSGDPLGLVHRDISPPNIIVGSDGVPLVLDFGIARTLHGETETRSGRVKGKSSYMAPEQIRGEPVTRAVDIFATTVVLWELLTGRRLFFGGTEQERMRKVLEGAEAMPPSLLVPRLPKGLDDIVLRGLRQNPRHRFRTALDMAEAVEKVIVPASQRAVAKWIGQTAGESLRQRGELLKQVEISDLAISIPAAVDTSRSVGASQVSYAPVAVARRSPVRWRSRAALAEGVAVAIVGVVSLSMLMQYGERPAERVASALSPTASQAAARLQTAPVIVPTHVGSTDLALSTIVASRGTVDRRPLEGPAAPLPHVVLVPVPAPPPVGAPVMVQMPVTAAIPAAVPAPPGQADPASPGVPPPPYQVVANVVEIATPQPVPTRSPRRPGIPASKAPGRPHPTKGTKHRPGTGPTAIAAHAASARGAARPR
jgi:serine/threonine protein kinase